MIAKTAAPSASASRVVATVRPRAPSSLGGAGVAVRRTEAAPLRSEFLGSSGLAGLCSAVAGLALETGKQAVRLVSPFMVECNNKKGKGATVAKITNRKRARVSGFRVRLQTPAGRRVIKARRAKGRKILAPASVMGGK